MDREDWHMTDYHNEFEQKMKQIKVDLAGLFKFVPIALLLLLALIFLTTCWFKVEPQEKGVVLRFGKYTKTVDPGLHFKWPWGIETVELVPVQRQRKQEFGFRTTQPGVRTQYSNQDFLEESRMLTGDLNVADVEWVTQYRINEPRSFLFNVRNPESTFRLMNEAVVREVVGDRTINEVLTYGRMELQVEAQSKLQDLCNLYGLGLVIDQVILQDVNPPEPVKPAFNAVNQAQQQKETLINQAQQEYNRVIPRARGNADRTIEESQGYATERVNRAKGEAQKFSAIFQEYLKAPEVTRQRLYLETMEKILLQVGNKTVIDQQLRGILPLLNLNSEEK